MAGWLKDGGLKTDEIAKIVAHLREISGTKAPEDDAWIVSRDPKPGKALYEASCGGCHGAKGEGGKGPALNNAAFLKAASDKYLIETVSRGRRGTAMAGFEEPSPVRRGLAREEMESIVAYIRSWQGDKK